MAEDTTLPQIQSVRLRVTKLDFGSGVPLPGANNIYVTDAFVKVGFGWNRKEGSEIEEENAQGVICANVKGKTTLKNGTISLEVCTPDPFLVALLNGGGLITDGDRSGSAAPALGEAPEAAVSIEVWNKRIKNGALDVDSPYAWWVYPRIENIVPADHEHANAALKPVFNGEAYENANWFDGPLNDWPAASDRVHQWIPTSSLPAVTGAATLSAS